MAYRFLSGSQPHASFTQVAVADIEFGDHDSVALL
jgi:hypothetical protein